jgi:hypothetical protein
LSGVRWRPRFCCRRPSEHRGLACAALRSSTVTAASNSTLRAMTCRRPSSNAAGPYTWAAIRSASTSCQSNCPVTDSAEQKVVHPQELECEVPPHRLSPLVQRDREHRHIPPDTQRRRPPYLCGQNDRTGVQARRGMRPVENGTASVFMDGRTLTNQGPDDMQPNRSFSEPSDQCSERLNQFVHKHND